MTYINYYGLVLITKRMNTMRYFLSFLFSLFFITLVAEDAIKLEDDLTETTHSITIGGKQLDYTATAGCCSR